MNLTEILQQLSEASVYAVLLVLAFVLFYFMHKNSIKNLKDFSNSSIEQIRKAYQDSNERLIKFMENVTKN